MPDEPASAADLTVEHATCLGCGCTCDDITIVVRGGRIAEAKQACPLGVRWFGDGGLPARVTSARRTGAAAAGTDPDPVAALASAALILGTANRALVYLADDVSCETQRAAIAVADVLGAALDSVTSATAGNGILAAQRRGRVGATLGEIRNRADTVLFWATDPAARYPRYTSRYAPDPNGLYTGGGRHSRSVVAIDIGGDRGPADADVRVAFSPEEEVAALGLIRAALQGRAAPGATPDSLDGRATALADRLRRAAYLAVVTEGEPSPGRDPRRSEALIALVETLNGSTRCVLSRLRAGGNRSGADATMTAQTGYPMAVDFARGAPRYRPQDDAAALLGRGEIDAALIVGSPASIPEAIRAGLARVTCIAIGPRASDSPYPTACTIDTGVAGVHERGTAIRMDDTPLPLRPALEAAAVAAFRDRVGSGTPVSRDTVTAVGVAGAAVRSASGPVDAARARRVSPECGVMDALAAADCPQDSFTLLRVLGAVLVDMGRTGPTPVGRPRSS